MNTEHHKNEIDQIKKHVKMLNITGAVAIGSLALAGILLVSDFFETPVENQEMDAKVLAILPEANAGTVDPNMMTNATDQPITSNENADIEPNPAKSAPEKEAEMPAAKKKVAFVEELQSFEASCNDGSILFQWVTEGSTKYAYEIEKTYDQVTYEVFSRAPQPEKVEGKNKYAVQENATVGDNAFYRLRKVIGKGKYEYSESVKVKCATAEAHAPTIDVFPNGNGSFRIMINTATEGPFKVTLTDATEKELATEEFLAKVGNNEFILSSSSIVRGNYVLRVSNDSMVKEKKVVLK